MKKSPIKKVSDKRIKLMNQRREMMEEKFGPRELWVCQFEEFVGPAMAGVIRCFGVINGHELKKRSQGGSIVDPENVVLLCNYHNDWIEDNPAVAKRVGLVR